MARRAVLLVLIAVLAIASVGLLDADRTAGLRDGSAGRSAVCEVGDDGALTADGGCCCTVAEAAGQAWQFGPFLIVAPAPAARSEAATAGVHRLPYHPPLLLG